MGVPYIQNHLSQQSLGQRKGKCSAKLLELRQAGFTDPKVRDYAIKANRDKHQT